MVSQTFKIRFCDIESSAPAGPGLYEIATNEGELLKVGISGNLQKRLVQHRQSKQSRLKLKEGGDWSKPSDVTSKQSILAKHLYFYAQANGYDLKTENGRQEYLEHCCHVLITPTLTREDARTMERLKEQSGVYKFVGLTKNLEFE